MDEAAVLDPVPVTGHVTAELSGEILDKGIRTSAQAAAFGGWTTYQFAGSEKPVQILPFDDARSRAVLYVSGTGPAYVGSMAQLSASPLLGGLLAAGGPAAEVRNQQALYLAPDGTHSVTVTVLIERYERP